ncbi:16S rRNA (uracil(1498)-N(3))-methyltransferase [Komagataeibacter rhaeticus]|nr:16S rRNA (uracil(1498)-N(3))-methyltransferase [Komagataeibacter rhaeticus]
MTRFCPVVTERTNTHRLNAARLESIAREAAEQCERLDVPGIDPLVPLVNLLAQWPEGISLFAALERSAPRPMAAPAQAGTVS